jgi:dipeptidyl aminopeptidase/acylaminoacyl peptidase
VEKVSFLSGGRKCHGFLYRPDRVEGRCPAVVMAHGLSAVKEMYLPFFAEYWAKRGFTVLLFDYRFFGESEGEPRGRLWPEEQLLDYKCAVHHLLKLDYVDPDRVCAWGTSFSGGHVVTLLATTDLFCCGVAQVPNVNSMEVISRYYGGLVPLRILSRGLLEDQSKGLPVTLTLPAVSRELPSLMPTDEAYEFFSRAEELFPTYRNMVTMDSVEKIVSYVPESYAPYVEKPIKFIVGEKDQTTPPDIARRAYEKIPAEKELVTFPLGHFGVYSPPWNEKAAEEALKWFKKHTE